MLKMLTLMMTLLLAGCGAEERSDPSGQVSEDSKNPYWFLAETSLDQETYGASWKDLPIDSIRFFRGGGQGQSPRFHCWIHSGGKAEYKGIRGVKNIGMHDGHIYLFDFARLCLLAEKLRIQERVGEYLPDGSHAEMVEITINMKNGDVHTITDWDVRSPVEAWAFYSTVELIVSKIHWKAR